MIIHRSLFVALTLISSATHTMDKLVRLNIPCGIAHHSMRYRQPMQRALHVTPRFFQEPKCVNNPSPSNEKQVREQYEQEKRELDRLVIARDCAFLKSNFARNLLFPVGGCSVIVFALQSPNSDHFEGFIGGIIAYSAVYGLSRYRYRKYLSLEKQLTEAHVRLNALEKSK